MNIDLEYPLDIDKILRKKKSIKKALLSNKNLVEKNIAILGGSTTSEIKKLEQSERVEEIAKMLSGKTVTKTSINNAMELLSQ